MATLTLELGFIWGMSVKTATKTQRDPSRYDNVRRRDRGRGDDRAVLQGVASRYRCARQRGVPAPRPPRRPLRQYWHRQSLRMPTGGLVLPTPRLGSAHGGQHHALALLEEVALGAITAAGIELKDIRALVVNTITGLAIPSLDAKFMNRLELPHSVERLPIFGLGCGGGVGGWRGPRDTPMPCRAPTCCFSP